MTVYVVIIPQDYMSAEVVGVYTKRKLAENAARNARDEIGRMTTVQIQPITLEG